MCGIAGFSGGFSPRLLADMGKAIAHRGPDDSGDFYDPEDRIGLCHRRLSIIDLSERGRQPMWDVSGRVSIVYNGELYNFRKLREGLIEAGFSFKSNSDTEVLLNLYLQHGTDMLQMLNGIFSFVLWDKDQRTMFIARDGLGVKPFYYSETSAGFVFASEMKALLQEQSVERTIDPRAVQNYLTFLWCPSPLTILGSVKKLEPGFALLVKEGKIRKKWQYYDLPYNEPVKNFGVEESIVRVQEAVRTAVERQMVSDVDVGAFLSGGLDSSAIVAFANKLIPDKKIKCFTIGFTGKGFREEGMVDDLPFAQRVAEFLGADLKVINVGSEMLEKLEDMIFHLDEPQADPAALNVLFITEMARKHGIKVLLSGAGGDDIFTGYRRHFALTLERYWSWLPVSVRAEMRRLSNILPREKSLCRRVAKLFQYADLNDDERLLSYFFWTTPESSFNLLSQDMRPETGAEGYLGLFKSSLVNLSGNVSMLNRMLYLESKHFLADHNLNYTDKMGMANGVEIRVPLLDPDLVALAASIPERYKQQGREGKWIFKKAMEKYLPNEVIYRPKTGFGAPIRSWLKTDLKPMVSEMLSEKVLENRGLFDPKSVKKLIAMNDKGLVDGAYTIFSLMCIEMWCRRFLDR